MTYKTGQILTADDLNALETAIEALTPEDSGWITIGAAGAPSFTNGWGNLAGHQPTQIRKIGDRVFMRGMVSGGTLTLAAFTLPTGWHPIVQQAIGVLVQNATTNNASAGTAHTHTTNHGQCFLTITAAGAVIPNSGHVANGYVSLNDVSFFID